jgi:hypothetical protein
VLFQPSFGVLELIPEEAANYTVKYRVSIGNLMILRIVAGVVAGVMSIWEKSFFNLGKFGVS